MVVVFQTESWLLLRDSQKHNWMAASREKKISGFNQFSTTVLIVP
jgi:hypothetical protein